MEEESLMEKEKKHFRFTGLYIFLFIIFKFLTMGWITVIMISFGFLLLYIFLYGYASKLLSRVTIKKKEKILYSILSFCFLMSGLTFVDFGDIEPSSKILKFIPDSSLSIINKVFFGICLVLSGYIIVKYSIKTKNKSFYTFINVVIGIFLFFLLVFLIACIYYLFRK